MVAKLTSPTPGQRRREAVHEGSPPVVVTAVGWMVFWGIVARLHLTMGDYLSAGFTAVAFILMAMVGLGYYLRESLTRFET